ncbi:DL-glycerol-3-phosphatase 1 [Magnaporthiopsis poae ATCC 64411]|uniref:DL-glycerol-3-phosphatase 1 n=1 Tax=Magnaporthiopsis poae (strain ATCC 64411 / 73-15) TaxID=644358 RepID=A0A0C4DT78_MAGP6|nr:DL-glycerol-3-phosphatase 1 [Magnaporthiopsis poae ATCC 64411]
MQYSYTAPPERVALDGFLFDMDGTIIDSTNAIVKHWSTVGEEIGVDPKLILETSHGRRSIDILKFYAPEKANYEYVSGMEAAIPKLYGDDAEEIPGARALLDSVRAAGSPWAIVTSGTHGLVGGWLQVLGPAETRAPHHVRVGRQRQARPDLLPDGSGPAGPPGQGCQCARSRGQPRRNPRGQGRRLQGPRSRHEPHGRAGHHRRARLGRPGPQVRQARTK